MYIVLSLARSLFNLSLTFFAASMLRSLCVLVVFSSVVGKDDIDRLLDTVEVY